MYEGYFAFYITIVLHFNTESRDWLSVIQLYHKFSRECFVLFG
jgi:hypothetical protein